MGFICHLRFFFPYFLCSEANLLTVDEDEDSETTKGKKASVAFLIFKKVCIIYKK